MSFGFERASRRPQRMQSQVDTKHAFYQADGSGRDYYICLEQSQGRYEPLKVGKPTGLADARRDVNIITHTPTGASRVSEEVFALVKTPARYIPSADPVVDDLRKHAMARGGRAGLRTLHRTLRLLDGNGSRDLDREELHQALKTYGIHATPQNMDAIMQRFGQGGGVSVTAVIAALREPMNQRRVTIVEQSYDLLRATTRGNLTFAEMKRLCDSSQHPEVLAAAKTAQQVASEFVQGWDKDGDALVGEDDFFDYYTDISTGIASDDYFELMLRNTWHLSGGEGVCRNTTCRRVTIVHTDGRQTTVQVPNDLGVSDRDTDEIRYRLEAVGFNDIHTVLLQSRIDPLHNKLTAQPKPKAPTPVVPERLLREELDADRSLAAFTTSAPPNMWRTSNKDMFQVQEPAGGIKLPTPVGYSGHRPGRV